MYEISVGKVKMASHVQTPDHKPTHTSSVDERVWKRDPQSHLQHQQITQPSTHHLFSMFKEMLRER